MKTNETKFEIKVYWKAVAPMLIKALQDPTKSEKDVEWAKSEITKMAEWIDKTQPELEKLSKVEERVENNQHHGGDAGFELARLYDIIKGGEAEDNSTHTDIQMSLRYDVGDEEYQVDSRLDVVRTRDGEPMGEAYETGQIFDTYAEALNAYYKLGHEYEKALTDGGWSMIGDGTVPTNPKKVFWSNEVAEDLKELSKWKLSDTDKILKRHLG